jgi:hypothetical protein
MMMAYEASGISIPRTSQGDHQTSRSRCLASGYPARLPRSLATVSRSCLISRFMDSMTAA